jgi:hypothetical protein
VVTGVLVADPSSPADLEEVRSAFRLGWVVAELRGRYRPSLFLHPEPGAAPGFTRQKTEQPLPLGTERKNREVRIEVFQAAVGLSAALGLKVETNGTQTLERIRTVVDRLENTNAATRRAQWPAVAQAFYAWDAQIQDALVVAATRAAAYQLGRALAETHWALDPELADDEMGSWAFLLGPPRQQTVMRLVARLSAYLGPLVTAAIEKSLKDWCELAGDAGRRATPEVRPALYRQGLLWRDLIRGERQPLDLAPLTGGDAWKKVGVYRRAVATLKTPLIVGGVFAALLIAGGALLVSGAKHPGLTTAISILGALGVTTAGLYARAKAEMTSLLASLRLAVDQQRVRQPASLCPPLTAAPPRKSPPRRIIELVAGR